MHRKESFCVCSSLTVALLHSVFGFAQKANAHLAYMGCIITILMNEFCTEDSCHTLWMLRTNFSIVKLNHFQLEMFCHLNLGHSIYFCNL